MCWILYARFPPFFCYCADSCHHNSLFGQWIRGISLGLLLQARCASDYHQGLSPEDIGAMSFPLYCRTLRYLITRLQQKPMPYSVNTQQLRSGTLSSVFAGTSTTVAKPAIWLEWRRTIENNWNNRELYRRFGENRDGRQITLSMPKFSALLQVMCFAST
jgi:hypothetical protein